MSMKTYTFRGIHSQLGFDRRMELDGQLTITMPEPVYGTLDKVPYNGKDTLAVRLSANEHFLGGRGTTDCVKFQVVLAKEDGSTETLEAFMPLNYLFFRDQPDNEGRTNRISIPEYFSNPAAYEAAQKMASKLREMIDTLVKSTGVSEQQAKAMLNAGMSEKEE